MADNTNLSAMSGGDVVATDDIAAGVAAGAKVQRIKVGFGADGSYSDAATTNPLPTAEQSTVLTGTLSATGTLIAATDVTSYSYVTVAVTGTFSATVVLQGSIDNTTWAAINRSNASATTGPATPPQSSLSGMATNSHYWTSVYYPYYRVQVTAYTSGTVNATMWMSRALPPAVSVTGTTAPITVIGNNAPSDSFAPGGQANSAMALAYMYNGSGWDRGRSFGTTGALGVTPVAGTSGGWSVSSQTALTNTDVAVKASAGQLGGYMIYNPNTSVAYVQVFDATTVSVTVGTTTPTYVLSIPAASAANLELTCGVAHATAITVAATTTPTGSTAPTTALTGAFFYK